MANICLVLTAPTLKENQEILARNSQYIHMAELRTDLLNPDQYEGLIHFSQTSSVPLILTCRKKIDGGQWIDEESRRIDLLTKCLEGKFAYIDLEMDLVAPELEMSAREKGVTIIRSFHDFQGIPGDLLEKMSLFEGDITKGAVYPQNSEDFYNLAKCALELKERRQSPYILLGMGDFGFPSRVLAEKLGSYLTFCSDSAAPSGAPGHCSASDLSELYNFKALREDTVINGIIGNPVSQSKSPHIHNGRYREDGLDAVYVPFLTDSLPYFLETARLLNITGLSVTVPFKNDIIPFIEHPEEAVKEIGASNTIYWRDSWYGANTDAYGFVKPLLDLLEREKLDGVKAAVIGAGGAAKAAIYALIDKGAQVAIFNRTVSKARELAKQFDCSAFSLNEESSEVLKEYSSIIVQTSSAGMPPLQEIDPLSFYEFTGEEVVYDIIYKPETTRLMARAKSAGCTVLGGYRMLEEQAKRQYDLFSGREL